MRIAGMICVVLGALNLVWVLTYWGPPGYNLSLVTSSIVVVLGIWLAFGRFGTAVQPAASLPAAKPSAPPAPDLSGRVKELEAELATAAHRLAELDAKHKDATERREALQVALENAEAKAEAAKKDQNLSTQAADAAVLNFLSMLQRKGRFVDFLMDDITKYDDRQVGAAARIVHEGCRSVLQDTLDIEPVRSDNEGVSVTLDKDYNPVQYRLVGRVAGQPPFKGVLLHRGWRTRKVSLPKVTPAAMGETVIAPAEVELG